MQALEEKPGHTRHNESNLRERELISPDPTKDDSSTCHAWLMPSSHDHGRTWKRVSSYHRPLQRSSTSKGPADNGLPSLPGSGRGGEMMYPHGNIGTFMVRHPHGAAPSWRLQNTFMVLTGKRVILLMQLA